jgi:hypothetical protein
MWTPPVGWPVPLAAVSVDTTFWPVCTLRSCVGGHQLFYGMHPVQQPQWTQHLEGCTLISFSQG